MACRGCSIALIDPAGDVLEIHTAAGVERRWQNDFQLRLGEGVAGRVALEGRSIYVPDVLKWDGYIVFDPSVRSLLTVPLNIQQRVIGTLTVDSDEPDAFSEADEKLLTIAATQAAIAIENARLYASLEQRAQNLADAYAELKKADRLKNETVQNVSHELRTPLTFVKGYVELLLDEDESTGALTAEQREYLQIVAEKTNVITRLVTDILSLQQAEQVPLQKAPVSLTKLAQRAVRGCTATAEKIGLSVVPNLPHDLPLVAADEDRLLQVFDNLLGNAIKFSPKGGQILVSVEEMGPMVQASVTDYGIGIPKDQHERIFERFYQVNGSAQRRYGGAGLGLAIVKRIVEDHGGQVWVESEPGRGSTFYFTVPKHQNLEI
jgi:signal transduction histidine kinase